MQACKNCHLLTNKNICSFCGIPTSSHWKGYLIIVDPKESRIADKMKLKTPGKYALKVR
jgi:DNA-directed RNA polymerase subunit E"